MQLGAHLALVRSGPCVARRMAAVVDPAARAPEVALGHRPAQILGEHQPRQGVADSGEPSATIPLTLHRLLGRHVAKRGADGILGIALALEVLETFRRNHVEVPVVEAVPLKDRNVRPGLKAAVESTLHLSLLRIRGLDRYPARDRPKEVASDVALLAVERIPRTLGIEEGRWNVVRGAAAAAVAEPIRLRLRRLNREQIDAVERLVAIPRLGLVVPGHCVASAPMLGANPRARRCVGRAGFRQSMVLLEESDGA